MAKIACPCGSVLFDQTDFISNKARLIPEQDVMDLADLIEESADQAFGYLVAGSKELFQCQNCSRLILVLADGAHYFSADDPERSKQVLRSIHGEQWKRNLRARWAAGVGEIWWGFGVEDEAFESDIGTWDELSSRYYATFERLRTNDVLRHAMLTRDGANVHMWPSVRDS